jgi:hypothetical protein
MIRAWWMKCEMTIPEPWRRTRLRQALERLVRLDEAWGKQDEAAGWRKQLQIHEAIPATR